MLCEDYPPDWIYLAAIVGGFLVSQVCGHALYAYRRRGAVDFEPFEFYGNKFPIVFPLSVSAGKSRFSRFVILTYRLSVMVFLLSFVSACIVSFPQSNCVKRADVEMQTEQ